MPTSAPTSTQPAPTATTGTAATATTATTSTAPASTSPYPAPAGSPDAGARLGQDVATPPSAAPGTQRAPLNLSLPRGPAVARQGSSGLLQMMPHPPEKKSKLAEDIEAAAKADCRKAYSGAGLLAAVPLLLDAARDKGCRW